MDSLSQIVLGGAVGEAVLGRKVGNKAVVWGAIAGTIPDLDIVPSQFMEIVTRIEFHRSVTHSLLFAILMSPVLALLVRKIHAKSQASLVQWAHLFFWSLFTHALLDCCTTWGTQLFWPFSEYRIAWKNISVVDPVYTIPFLIFLVAVMFKRKKDSARSVLNWAGLGISTFYLCLTFLNQQIMTTNFKNELNEQKINYSRITLFPTIFNNILWRGIAETDDGFYIGYASFFDEKIKPGFTFFPKNYNLLAHLPADSRLVRFPVITDGFYILSKIDSAIVLSDLRFDQLAGWEFPDAPFIFNYRFQVDSEKKLKIIRARPSFDGKDAGQFFTSLTRRIKGAVGEKAENTGR
ncbi:MAG: metal-dependent hydrolase [Calditrichaeota bacterium]|nr:MAG: metal-dependent hydrolase [Calditrichota bacterium]